MSNAQYRFIVIGAVILAIFAIVAIGNRQPTTQPERPLSSSVPATSAPPVPPAIPVATPSPAVESVTTPPAGTAVSADDAKTFAELLGNGDATAPAPQTPKVSAQRLWSDYDDNSVAAADKYRAHLYAIQGIVSDIAEVGNTSTQKLCLGGPCSAYVGIDGKVAALFGQDDRDDTTDLHKGSRVTIGCTVLGKVDAPDGTSTVVGTDCFVFR